VQRADRIPECKLDSLVHGACQMFSTPVVSRPPQALPPGPRSPAWWQLGRFSGNLLRFLDECHRRFGDAFTLDVAADGPFVMLSDPEVVREVFRADPDVLHSGEANSLFKVLLATLFSQARLSRPTRGRSRARRYGIVLGPDDGARVIVRGSIA
jgi:cytochrome P450